MVCLGDDPAASFEPHRARLARLAYRMTGSVADAEDVVQDAFLRRHGADRAGVREPAAFLHRVVTRLCLDRLGAARHRRETYIGPWIPEPLVEVSPEDRADDVTLAMMMVLERLSPLERAAFLLHDVFGLAFDEVGRTLDREPAACRQLATRARRHVHADRPRFPVDAGEAQRLVTAFLEASRRGDAAGLSALLTDDARAYTDGGGVRHAALNPIFGRRRVVALFEGLARKRGFAMPPDVRHGWIDGLPGFVTREDDGLLQTTALAIDGDRIAAIYIVRNPAKLAHLGICGTGERPKEQTG